MAILILVIVFGAVVTAGIPIIIALIAIIIAVGVSFLVGQAFDLSFFIVNIITIFGLAVGIDYSLFIIQRYREERLRGLEKLDAIVRTGETASRAVLFSGGAVVIALLGLLLVPDTGYRSVGIGAISVAIAAVIAALTLLPAILSTLGDKVNALRVPFAPRLRLQDDDSGGMWSAIAAAVMRRPVVSLVLSAGLLIAAAVPYLTIELGTAGVTTLPEGNESLRAFEVLQEEFSARLVSPVEIVIDADDVNDDAITAAIGELMARIGEDPLFDSVSLETNEAGDLALVSALMTSDPLCRRRHQTPCAACAASTFPRPSGQPTRASS